MGYDIQVKAASLKIDNNTHVDIWGGSFIKQTKGSIFSEIAFGFDNYYQCNIELWGSKGKITSNRIFTAPPNYEAEIFLENNIGNKRIKVEASNQFCNMLLHFYKNILKERLREEEYTQNINQARLLSEFISLAHE